MGNLHRIQWIDRSIREGRFPNCSRIAREFDISVRQASRDVEYLKYSLQAPLEYSPERKGYYYTGETFTLPSFQITESERQALAYLAQRYRNESPPDNSGEMTHKLAGLFEKLAGAEKDRSSGTDAHGGEAQTDAPGPRHRFPVFDVNGKLLDISRRIDGAVRRRATIEIVYLDSGNRKTVRSVRPYLVFSRNRVDYVHGHCELRNAERDFRFDRIASVRETGARFELPAQFDPVRFANGPGFSFTFSDPYRALVAFGSGLAPGIVRGRTPYRNEPISMPGVSPFEPVGDVSISFRSSNMLIAALATTGRPFSIIAPGWLREKACRFFSSILERAKRQQDSRPAYGS